MSFEHLSAAGELDAGVGTPLTARGKAVLWVLALRACRDCGLAWPGARYLEAKTGLGESAVRGGLRELERAGYLKIHAYPTGGRGRATEYIVLPALLELSTAPCGECRSRMKTRRHATPLEELPAETRCDATPIVYPEHIPRAEGVENPVPRDPHEVRESDSVTRSRASRSTLTRADVEHPRPAIDHQAKAKQMVADLGAHLALTPKTPPKDDDTAL